MKELFALSFLFLFILYSGCCGLLEGQSYYYGNNSSDSLLPPPRPNIDASIIGCTTNFGLDGETTIVYATVVNSGNAAAENVSVTFEASDGLYGAPPKADIGILPANRQITVSRTLLSKFGTPTDVQISVNAMDTYTINRFLSECSTLDKDTLKNLDNLIKAGLMSLG